jgi:hypothetical protein
MKSIANRLFQIERVAFEIADMRRDEVEEEFLEEAVKAVEEGKKIAFSRMLEYLNKLINPPLSTNEKSDEEAQQRINPMSKEEMIKQIMEQINEKVVERMADRKGVSVYTLESEAGGEIKIFSE